MNRRHLLCLALAGLAAPAAALAAEDSKKKKAGGLSYIPISTLTGATRKPYGRRGVMTIECGLDVPDNTLRTRAQASIPRLRAAYVETIQVYAAGLPIGAVPNADFLSRSLQGRTDEVLGKPGARFLLGAIIVN